MKHFNNAALTLISALVLGLCFEALFYGEMLGLSVPLFALLFLGALFFLGRRWGTSPRWRNLWPLIPLLFFAGMIAVRANPFLTALNVLACLALVGLILHLYADGRLERLGLLGYLWALLATGANALYRAAPLIPDSADWRQVRMRSRGSVTPVLRGCLLALPALLLFTCLLSSADLIFAHYVRELAALRLLRDLLHQGWRVVLALCVGWLAAGGLAYALQRRPPAPAEGAEEQMGTLESVVSGLQRILSLGWVETVIILASVNLLFLTFVAIQFTYLFGGGSNVSLQGFTYAEYARRGFAELVTVAALALGLILGLEWLSRRDTAPQRIAFSALGSVMVALVLCMLASAFQRMRLYEAAYGYTELRLYVYIFMIWLGVTLLWFGLTLWRRQSCFAIGAFVAALGFLISLNAINPDAFIARQNLVRYQQTGKVDAAYLTTLSEDVVPVLLQSGEDLPEITTHLRERRQSLQASTRWRRFPAWNLARWQAYRALEGLP